MKSLQRVTTGVVGVLLLMAVLSWSAQSAGADTLPSGTGSGLPAVSFREVKITGDEFVVIRANQAIGDLSSYWLSYSSNDLATNIVPTQQLPAISLATGQTVLLTSDAAPTCDAIYTSKLSVSLSDTKGLLQLRQLVNIDKNTSTFTTVDSVNWIKLGTTDKTPVIDNLDLRKETGLSGPVWYHDAAGAATPWTAGSFANCTLTVPAGTGNGNTTPPQTYTWPSSTAGPPAVILSLAADDSAAADNSSSATTSAIIPASDLGLLPPQITELLPNPVGTGSDASDEFIELYNPNAKPFDLTGFVLQTGATTKHSYTFPAGTTLPASSFVAFYSADTGLSLSNTSGASDLLDPLGALLTQSDQYGSAKDGQSWALANGKWYWTLQATPNKSNVVAQPTTAATKSAVSKSKSTATKKAKGASTAKKSKSTSATSTPLSATTAASETEERSPIHPGTLAVIAGLAVAYGLYEYRLDMANFVQRFKRHRALSRVTG